MEKIKLNLTYSFSSDPRDIFLALTKPDFLQNWIAERVSFDQSTGVYTFYWTSSSESAKIEEMKKDEYVRWKWVDGDRDDYEYVSFRIEQLDEDDYVDLHIEDFCDKVDQEILTDGWNEQMERLESVLR